MHTEPTGYQLRLNYFYSDLEPLREIAHLPAYLWVFRHTRRLVEDLEFKYGRVRPVFDTNIVRGVFAHGCLFCTTGERQHLPWSSGVALPTTTTQQLRNDQDLELFHSIFLATIS